MFVLLLMQQLSVIPAQLAQLTGAVDLLNDELVLVVVFDGHQSESTHPALSVCL